MRPEETELVTVVIPTHGRANLTDRAVRSVLAQTYPAVELVIVDDASPVAYVAPSGESPRGVVVRTVRLERNGGPGAAREAGRRLASGAYISYLDSDDSWEPRFLEVMVSALRAAPGAGMAYCASLAMRGSDATGIFRGSHRVCHRFLPTVLWSRPWATSACLWRRSVVDTLGAWLPLWSWEDKEYEVRAGCHDVAVVHVAEPLCLIQVDAPERLSARKRPEDARSFTLALLAIARDLEASSWRRDTTVRPRMAWLLLSSSIWCAAQGQRSLTLRTIRAAWRWSDRKGDLAALIGVSPPLVLLGPRAFLVRLLRWVRGYRPIAPEMQEADDILRRAFDRVGNGLAAWARGSRRRDGIIVLSYHGVVERRTDDRLERNLHTLSDFREQLGLLRRERVIGLDQLWEELRSGAPLMPGVVLTFDDGYENNLVVAELLARLRLPWAVFVPTGCIGHGRTIWTVELSLLVLCGRNASLEAFGSLFSLRTQGEREEAFQALRGRLKALPALERVVHMEALRRQFPEGETEYLLGRFPSLQLLSWSDVRGIASTGAVVGSHGVFHEIHHAAQPAAIREHELVTSRQELEKQLGREVRYFAFPNGDCTPASGEEVSRAGYRLAFTTRQDTVRVGAEPGVLPRLEPPRSRRSLEHKVFS